MSGFGLSLLLAPVVQLALPGLSGIRLVNGTAAALNTLLLVPSWRSVDLPRAALIGLPGIATVLLLSPLLAGSSARAVSILAGAATLAAVGLALRRRPPALLGSRRGGALAGLLGGALTVTSGAGGAPIAAHAAAQPAWSPRQLVATVQLVFLPVNVVATAVTRVRVPGGLIVACAVGGLVGLAVGQVIRGRVPAAAVRRGVLGVAVVGSLLVLAKAA